MIPVDKTGLHCGETGESYGIIDALVIPVDKTGLHCGNPGEPPPSARWAE